MEGLYKILENHIDETFYTTLYGDVVLKEADSDKILLKAKDNYIIRLLRNGKYSDNGEVVIFPSYENRDWNGWSITNRWKNIKSYEDALKVLSLKNQINDQLTREQILYIKLTTIRDAINSGEHIFNIIRDDHYIIYVALGKQLKVFSRIITDYYLVRRDNFLVFKNKDRAEYFKNQFKDLLNSYF